MLSAHWCLLHSAPALGVAQPGALTMAEAVVGSLWAPEASVYPSLVPPATGLFESQSIRAATHTRVFWLSPGLLGRRD